MWKILYLSQFSLCVLRLLLIFYLNSPLQSWGQELANHVPQVPWPGSPVEDTARKWGERKREGLGLFLQFSFFLLWVISFELAVSLPLSQLCRWHPFLLFLFLRGGIWSPGVASFLSLRFWWHGRAPARSCFLQLFSWVSSTPCFHSFSLPHSVTLS